MNKIWLIFKREYLTKVKKRVFIVTTILVPVLFVASSVGIAYISNKSSINLKLIIKDDSGLFENKIRGLDTEDIQFAYYSSVSSKDSLLDSYEKLGFNGLLYIPKLDLNKKYLPQISYYSNQTLGFSAKAFIEDELTEVIKQELIKNLGYDAQEIARLDQKLNIQPVDDNSEDQSDITELATGIGYLMAFIIYIYLFVYGAMVMRSVMEEKTNRIVEVIITTIKPFQLMMGKILGIGAVGLTQLVIWLFIFILTFFAVSTIIGPEVMTASQNGFPSNQMEQMSPEDAQEMVALIMQQIGELNWWRVIISFIFYFIFGYILYAAQFAAIGSAVSDDADVQTLMFPISIPIIISIVIMVSTIDNPYSSMAKWGSIIPLTAPVVMMSRIPFFDNSFWIHQLLSMLILIISSIGMVWIAGKIYRIGILIQGEKISFRKIWKWIRY